ncbi:hypothetical protein ABMA28_014743 [Loxostege sticticalis]|uniref:Uncharacterized protein n=1 Tax=Loxostege sticticalis TaxID=481309 RepID=A0ABD0TC33_LOXSC
MVAPSPSLLTNNGPASNISTVPELEDFINSVPSLPSHTDTSANFTLLTPETSSVTSTQTISGTCDEVTEKFKGKGRKVNKKQWKDVKRKKNRNTGKSYVSRDGTKRPARKLNPMCHKCQFKCPGKFDDHIRTKIFENFWKLGNNVRQWDFISKYCEKITKRSRTTEGESRRQNTITYSLVMFLNTLGIGAGMLDIALKKSEAGNGAILPDARGGCRKKIIDEDMIKSVCDHVKSFQPVESHYVRSRTSKLYLDGSLSYSRMFNLYIEWLATSGSNYRNPARTLRQYQDIVNKHFNLGFHIPRKDQCDICHVHKNLPKPISDTEHKAYRDHIRNKEIARELKLKFKKLSESNPTETLTTTYDFQKIHGMPHGQASILYYKRKLSVYNLTFYSLGQKKGTCFVLDETVAKKGATEVATCNRNRVVFLAYLQAAKDFNVTITHVFLERGHTQNEGDSVHALIERFAKNKMIYAPDDWYNMIRWCKQDGNPYRVVQMQSDEFIDFKKFLCGPNWVKNMKGEKMFWSQIRQLLVLPNETDRIYYKTDFCSHEYDCIVLYTPRQLRRRKGTEERCENSLPKAYLEKFAVPKSKLQDLKYLCERQIIPQKYHSFYDGLVPGEDDVVETNED